MRKAASLHTKGWPLRYELIPAKKSVSHHPLVDPKKVPLPPLHIKLGIIKNFVKAMVKYNKEGEGFQYIKSKFPQISDAKIKEGVFIGPQIRELIKDPFFEETLNTLEKAAWNAFKSVLKTFWGTTDHWTMNKQLRHFFIHTMLWDAIYL